MEASTSAATTEPTKAIVNPAQLTTNPIDIASSPAPVASDSMLPAYIGGGVGGLVLIGVIIAVALVTMRQRRER